MVYPYARVKSHKCEKILSITGLIEAVCIGQRGILKTNSIKELTMASTDKFWEWNMQPIL